MASAVANELQTYMHSVGRQDGVYVSGQSNEKENILTSRDYVEPHYRMAEAAIV
jgi:hypothetical protein